MNKEKIKLHLQSIIQSVSKEISNKDLKPYKIVTIRYSPEELMDMVFTGSITKPELYEIFCKIIFESDERNSLDY